MLLGACTSLDDMVYHHDTGPRPAASESASKLEQSPTPAQPDDPGDPDAAVAAAAVKSDSDGMAPAEREDATTTATELAGIPDAGPGAAPALPPTGVSFGRREVSGRRVFQVQLAAYHDSRDAENGWDELIKRAPDLLDGVDPVIVKVQLGESEKPYFRLRTTAYRNESGAEALCAALDAQNIDCFVVEIPAPS